jgi:hypothetical protein
VSKFGLPQNPIQTVMALPLRKWHIDVDLPFLELLWSYLR